MPGKKTQASGAGQRADFEEALRRISHDLRNSLHVVQQGFQILGRLPHDEAEFQKTLDSLKREHELASKLVTELISLDRSWLALKAR